jgi:hypothetical protein
MTLFQKEEQGAGRAALLILAAHRRPLTVSASFADRHRLNRAIVST